MNLPRTTDEETVDHHVPERPHNHLTLPPSFIRQCNNDGDILSSPNLSRTTSFSSGIQSPKISMSQFKLNELSKTNLQYATLNGNHKLEPRNEIEDLNNFGLKELRSGFFDSSFTPPNQFALNKFDLEDEHPIHKASGNGKWFDSLKVYCAEKLSYVSKIIKEEYQVLIKIIIAYTIALTFCLVGSINKWLGKTPTFLPLVVLLCHPGHSLGVQLELTLESILGGAIAVGWASISYVIDDSRQPVRDVPGGILACSLILGSIFISFIRAKFIRSFYFCLSFGIGLIYLSTNYNKFDPHSTDGIAWRNCWSFGIPYLFGLLLSLLVSICIFPHLRYSEATMVLVDAVKDIKSMIEICSTIDDSNSDGKLQSKINLRTVLLSDYFREYSNEFTISLFKLDNLKDVRNNLQLSMGPLRALPSSSVLFSGEELKQYLDTDSGPLRPSVSPGAPMSVSHTPVPKGQNPHISHGPNSGLIYISVMKEHFKDPSMSLVKTMLGFLDTVEECLLIFGKIEKANQDQKDQLKFKLEHFKSQLRNKIHGLDVAYRRFTKTDYFCRELLTNTDIISIFLYLKYLRQVANWFLSIQEAILNLINNSKLLTLNFPDYPWKRSLQRLSKMSLHDQGNPTVFLYLDIASEIDEIFEKIYNVNTSRIKERNNEQSDEKHVERKPKRALDHNDFGLHNTSNPLRYKLFLLTKNIYGYESKYAFKTTVAVIMVSLPGFLERSYKWYQDYNCWWAGIILFIVMNPKLRGNVRDLCRRALLCVLGIFWAWCANQSYHYQNGYIVMLFSLIWCCPLFIRYICMPHARSGLLGLMSYTILTINIYQHAHHQTQSIWKNCWIPGLSILIGFGISIIINWFLWPFMTTNEVRKSMSSLISHISQSYQFISDRYLYRDLNDDPTKLTLQLANVREVRMIRNLYSVKKMLDLTKTEFSLIENFNTDLYIKLLESCDNVFSKIIEARISGVYYHVWENDGDESITEELLPLRRDSVATVIFIFCILSNSFMSRNKIPKYLPSAIESRKKLYNRMSELQLERYHKLEERRQENISNGKNMEDLKSMLRQKLEKENHVETNEEIERTHWTEIHGMAFARAYTDITQEIERIIEYAKLILGEEDI